MFCIKKISSQLPLRNIDLLKIVGDIRLVTFDRNINWNWIDLVSEFGIEFRIAGFKLKVDFKRYGYFNSEMSHSD